MKCTYHQNQMMHSSSTHMHIRHTKSWRHDSVRHNHISLACSHMAVAVHLIILGGTQLQGIKMCSILHWTCLQLLPTTRLPWSTAQRRQLLAMLAEWTLRSHDSHTQKTLRTSIWWHVGWPTLTQVLCTLSGSWWPHCLSLRGSGPPIVWYVIIAHVISGDTQIQQVY